jgi:radical SAM protein with 4Fe4S-binding SPASM domain
MSYLILKSNCVAVFGENGASLYNVNNRNYYSLNENLANILRDTKAGTPIADIKEKYSEAVVDDFLHKLINSDVAVISDHFYIEENFRIGSARPSTSLEFTTCYIELPADCQVNCEHCNEPKIFSCLTCKKPSELLDSFDLQFYKNLLGEILKTPVKTIIFHGGDPLTNETEVLDLLRFTREHAEQNVQIILKTNGDLFNEQQIQTFLTYRINPLVVFNCVNQEEQDIAQKLKSLEVYLHTLSSHQVTYFANLVFHDPDPQYHKPFIDLVRSYHFANTTISVVVASNDSLQRYANINFSEKLAYNFSLYKDLHPCLNGILAITADKKIIPCPSMNNHVLLDLNHSSFMDLFDEVEKIDKYWRFTLQEIDKCKPCKLRYSCVDCRAVEEVLVKSGVKKEICYLGV